MVIKISSQARDYITLFNPIKLKENIYSKFIHIVLRLYENWILTSGTKETLYSIKKKEFNDRLKYINPYTRSEIENNNKELAKLMGNKTLENITPYQMHNFTITYDRHKNKYGPKIDDFPDKYSLNESVLNYRNDPYWYDKLQPRKLNFKKYILFLMVAYALLKLRIKYIEKVDAQWRKEQRNMQNIEVAEIPKEPILIKFKNKEGDIITTEELKDQFTVLWFDHRLQLFLYIKDELPKKRLSFNKIGLYLVSNSDEMKEKMEQRLLDFQNKNKEKNIADTDILVYKKEDNIFEEESNNYDIKNDYFYIIDPDGRIIDCARIYSFEHESNILKRIVAKINKNVDENIRYL